MTMVLGTWVPDLGGVSADHEVCHSFVYRWLIGRGVYTGNYPDPLVEYNGQAAEPILWPIHGGAARTNNQVNVQAGDIVGFCDANDDLVHSMIAVTATSWIGTRNQNTFGVGPGRRVIANVNGGFPGAALPAPVRLGWVGNANQWRTMGGIVTVTHRTPLASVF